MGKLASIYTFKDVISIMVKLYENQNKKFRIFILVYCALGGGGGGTSFCRFPQTGLSPFFMPRVQKICM